MCLMLCAPLDWQYAELPSSASDAVLCSVLVRKMWDIETNRKKEEEKRTQTKQFLSSIETKNELTELLSPKLSACVTGVRICVWTDMLK